MKINHTNILIENNKHCMEKKRKLKISVQKVNSEWDGQFI